MSLTDGVCNLCRLETEVQLAQNFRVAQEQYEAFALRPPDPGRPYDCLLMYSGGKDSTYLLDQFVREGRRVLAYTFDVPFESVRAAENVELGREKIAATFVTDRDDEGLRKVMREVFARPTPTGPGEYLEEKLPCVSCRTFFVLRALLLAYEQRIPAVVMCADPQQFLTMESDVPEIVRGYYRRFGRQNLEAWFGGRLEALLFAEADELPQLVFPYVAQRHVYDPDRMVAELRERGLYRSSPLETHCTLFPLLNYYSFKHWNCMFYKLNASSHVRAVARSGPRVRATYSLKFPPEFDVIAVEDRLRDLVTSLVSSGLDPASFEPAVIEVLTQFGVSDDAARFAAANFVNIHQIAAENGIPLP